jgi:hypothetical protein
LMERGKENKENLPGSLQSLRGEFDGIQEISRERRIDMPQAQVTMDVRKVNDKVSVIDVKGELTAFAEGVLMQAYTQGWHRAIRECQSGGGGLRKVSGRSTYLHPPRKIRHQCQECKHTSLACILGDPSEVRLTLAQKTILVTRFVTLEERWCCRVVL